MLLLVYLSVSAVLGVAVFAATCALWPPPVEALAKPGRATVLFRLSQSLAAGAAVALFWPLAAVAAVVVPVAVAVWRFTRPTPLQRDAALYEEFRREMKSQ
jgi:hypothetical protein